MIPDSVSSIGVQAFRGCSSLVDVTLSENVSTIGNHAFYGCNRLTVYSAASETQAGWESYWNSSYRPVLWGCTLSEEGYVVSYEKGTITNEDERKTLSAPAREGYEFMGWTRVQGGNEVEFSANDLVNVPDGTVLYAIWAVATDSDVNGDIAE